MTAGLTSVLREASRARWHRLRLTKAKPIPRPARRTFSRSVTALAVAMLFPAFAVAQSSDGRAPPPENDARVREIRARGTLRVAVLDEYPWLKQMPSKSLQPFEGPAWLLATEYAARLGVRLETIPVTFSDKVAVLLDDRADLTVAPLIVTADRAKIVDLIPYSAAAHCVFGRADNPRLLRANTLDDLNRPDITIGTIRATPQGSWLRQRLPKAKWRSIRGNMADLATAEVLARRADVAPIDKYFVAGLAKRVPGLVTVPQGAACMASNELTMPIAMATAKGQPAFLDWLPGRAA